MSWPVSRLGDVCEIVVGRTPSRSNPALWGGEHTWVSIADLGKSRKVETSKEQLSDEGALLLKGRLAAPGTVLLSFKLSIGKVGIVSAPVFTNEAIAALPIKPRGDLLPEFLARYLESIDLSGETNRAAMGQTLNLPILRAIPIPLPPLPEQRRIASILDRIDLERSARLRSIEMGGFMEMSLLELAAEEAGGQFERVTLADLVDTNDRINYGVVQPGESVSDGIPMIRAGDLSEGRVDRSRLRHISAETEKAYTRSRLRGNEILVTCVGSIGEVAEVSPADVGSNIARAVARVPLRGDVNRDFVMAVLRSGSTQGYFRRELRTVAQPTLNIKQLAETPVLLPSQEVQARLSQRVAVLRTLDVAKASHLSALGELFSSLQHRAFRGEL